MNVKASALAWERALTDAEAGNFRRLRSLLPNVRRVIVRDGEPHPFVTALAERPTLIWRVAVDLSRRGDRDLLAFLATFRGPVPEEPESLREAVYRSLLHPRVVAKEGAPFKIAPGVRSRIEREAIRLLNLETTESPTRFKRQRAASVRELAGEAGVSEVAIRKIMKDATNSR